MSETIAAPPAPASATSMGPTTPSPFGPGGSNASRGIGFMVAATLMFCLGDTLMKLAAGTLPTTEVMFVRSLVATLTVTAALIVTGTIRRTREALVQAMALRAGADASASLLFQSALARMQFADSMGKRCHSLRRRRSSSARASAGGAGPPSASASSVPSSSSNPAPPPLTGGPSPPLAPCCSPPPARSPPAKSHPPCRRPSL
jgi:hypothetical protein